MKVNDDFSSWNAESQKEDPGSVWTFWKEALAARKNHDVLVSFEFLGEF